MPELSIDPIPRLTSWRWWTPCTVLTWRFGILNQSGIHKFYLEKELCIGIWAVSNSLELRHAMNCLFGRIVGTVHMEDPRVPECYRWGKPAHLEEHTEHAEEQRGIRWGL